MMTTPATIFDPENGNQTTSQQTLKQQQTKQQTKKV
jgi:hypothetical protein